MLCFPDHVIRCFGLWGIRLERPYRNPRIRPEGLGGVYWFPGLCGQTSYGLFAQGGKTALTGASVTAGERFLTPFLRIFRPFVFRVPLYCDLLEPVLPAIVCDVSPAAVPLRSEVEALFPRDIGGTRTPGGNRGTLYVQCGCDCVCGRMPPIVFCLLVNMEYSLLVLLNLTLPPTPPYFVP